MIIGILIGLVVGLLFASDEEVGCAVLLFLFSFAVSWMLTHS